MADIYRPGLSRLSKEIAYTVYVYACISGCACGSRRRGGYPHDILFKSCPPPLMSEVIEYGVNFYVPSYW